MNSSIFGNTSIAARMAWGLALLCLLGLGAPAAEEATTRKLFDGKTLKGWVTADGKPVTRGWTVEDGMLVRSGHGGDIFTEQEFGDFDLTLEWKIAPGVNSGIKYRVRPYGGQQLGPEYQILDETAKDAKGGLGATGSLYALYPPTVEDAQKPAGEWNHTRILVRGTKIEHHLNGVKLLEADTASDEWKQRKARSKFAKVEGFGEAPGRIMLQDHGPAGIPSGSDQIWFRNLQVRERDSKRGDDSES